MRALIQRVSRGSVTIDGAVVSEIRHGMVVLLGIKKGDTMTDVQYLAERVSNLRIFDDDAGVMNKSIIGTGCSALVVSQFTLYADTHKGNRPNYMAAAPPEEAEPLYDFFVTSLKGLIGKDKVGAGIFRAMMSVEIINDGPVTIMLESK